MTTQAIVQNFSTHDIEAKKELFKRTFMKGASDDELHLFATICSRTGLSPEMKQIYPISRYDSKSGKHVFGFQTSIDGFRLIAERTGKYSPGKEAAYVYDAEGKIIAATAYVKKMTADGTWHEVAATAFFEEYAQRSKDGRPTQFWEKMPHVMLSKCAESLALRKAFPAELSGLYTQEEMSQATTAVPEFLTEEQIAQIDSLIVDDEEGKDKIISMLNLKSIYDLPVKEFDRSIAYLNKRKEKANGSSRVA